VGERDPNTNIHSIGVMDVMDRSMRVRGADNALSTNSSRQSTKVDGQSTKVKRLSAKVHDTKVRGSLWQSAQARQHSQKSKCPHISPLVRSVRRGCQLFPCRPRCVLRRNWRRFARRCAGAHAAVRTPARAACAVRVQTWRGQRLAHRVNPSRHAPTCAPAATHALGRGEGGCARGRVGVWA